MQAHNALEASVAAATPSQPPSCCTGYSTVCLLAEQCIMQLLVTFEPCPMGAHLKLPGGFVIYVCLQDMHSQPSAWRLIIGAVGACRLRGAKQ